MNSSTAMKSDNVCSITIIDDTSDLPHFEFFDEGRDEKRGLMKKCKLASTSASRALVQQSKRIHAFVGPSKLYMVMKGMKLRNFEVTTVRFIGNVPRLDIPLYLTQRPNVTKVIMDSYGPVSCTWTEFDGVRKNLKSFVVRSGATFVDVCDFIDL